LIAAVVAAGYQARTNQFSVGRVERSDGPP